MARARSKVSEQQRIYVDEIMTGSSKSKAAKAAGYPSPQGLDKSATVKQEIALAREKLTDLTQIRRVDVIDGIMDGIAMARMMSDPANVIKGWTEVAKILGHYAPEVKTLNLTVDAQRQRSKFEALTNEQLYAITQGRDPNEVVTDVEAKVVD